MKTTMKIAVIAVMGMSFGLKAQDNKISTTGDVGIGTTSPSHKLSVSSSDNSVLELSSDTSGTWMDFENTEASAGSRVWSMGHLGSSGKFGIYQRDNTNEYRFLITKEGKVGIGTSGPSHKLSVSSSDNSVMELSSGTSGTWMDFENTAASAGSRLWSMGHAGSSGMFGIYQRDNTNEYRFLITKEGKVGIGTPGPSHKLSVSSSDNSVMELSSDTSGTWMDFENKAASAGSRIWSIGHNGRGGAFGIYQRDNTNEYRLYITNDGKVGIGTNNPKGFQLGVNGKVAATEVKVATYSNWSDFVFYDNYQLPTLKEVEAHIQENGHLKDIPSAEEVEKDGFFLGEMDAKLLQKIEELTLYTIQQEKKIESLQEQNSKIESQQKQIDDQKNEIEELKKLVQSLLKN
ncbi:hypothetical protein SAMN04489761_1837 [Tenacibaculum sp. MAR_2009_124]|uniref:DUF4200 domain-containing protein n=1 Tax=Tenacibaculum sp. MAR_2009_124 TaxID=1250059 RepID=UPI0008943A56|nr:DUF4200 domain-containing protein [Tenacibaculum sp. MAR_2009_124]SEB80957.1 hypothetical protein SAMN04489761_1837 [Tenacibaculum sp. MAR_2009_124]